MPILRAKNPFMLIVADSGSTKTDWKIWSKQHGENEIQTIGLNPYFVSGKDLTEVLQKHIHPYIDSSNVREVHFYGAGCSHSDKILEVESALSGFFSAASISVESDLLGAARALCGNDAGIAVILGTGSNSCYFDGNIIQKQLLSLGYVLGDEGSGAVLGKKILKAALSGEMPDHLHKTFQEQFPYEPSVMLENIYRQPFPNRFLASFAPFAIRHQDDTWVSLLIDQHLRDFFTNLVFIYPDYTRYPLHFTGSIAWNLKELINRLCEEFGITPGKFLEKPIEDLMKFHLNNYQD